MRHVAAWVRENSSEDSTLNKAFLCLEFADGGLVPAERVNVAEVFEPTRYLPRQCLPSFRLPQCGAAGGHRLWLLLGP